MKCRKAVFVMLASLFVFTFAQSSLWSGEPAELVKGVVKKFSYNEIENIQEHKTLLWKEISPSFDFREISKRVMGQYWENLLDEEKSEFEVLFTNHIKLSYIIGKTNPLLGKKIVSIREKMSNKFAKVQTELLTKTEKEVSADFYLYNQNGEWKIYDLVIEGVSIVNNYRSQIHSTISRNSFEGLVQIMRQNQGKGNDASGHRILVSGWAKPTR
jgi:phospholipid transport system substrate-binding protein